MKFSTAYKINLEDEDDWFDPILGFDTRLFIDPFLIFRSQDGLFRDSHNKIVSFFNEALKIVAATKGETDNVIYKKAKNILLFPEVSELSLGYSTGHTKGAGSSYKFSELMIEAIWIAIQKGIKDIKHFEELEILNEGIGADRISDMTANILKREFIMYTKQICDRHNIPTIKVRVRNSDFDFSSLRWISEYVDLPVNPKDSSPVLLVPNKYLSVLPEIISSDFRDYLASFENERLRNDFNYDLSKKMDKKTIVQIARSCPELVERYVNRKEDNEPGSSYDFNKDKDNHVMWHDRGLEYVDNNPVQISAPSNDLQFLQAINKILNSFKSFVEDKGGDDLLWNDDGSERTEQAAQRTFAGVAIPYCEVNNVDLSKETNMGRGPVDFKFSNGYLKKQLIEVKKASTASGLFRKIKNQLPEYLKSEDTKNGIYLIIRYSKKDDKRIEEIGKIINELNNSTDFSINQFVINAEKKPSASKM